MVGGLRPCTVKPKDFSFCQTYYIFKEMPQGGEDGEAAASFLSSNKTHLIILQSLHFLGCKMGSDPPPQSVLLTGDTVCPGRTPCHPISLPLRVDIWGGGLGRPTSRAHLNSPESPRPPVPFAVPACCHPGWFVSHDCPSIRTMC